MAAHRWDLVAAGVHDTQAREAASATCNGARLATGSRADPTRATRWPTVAAPPPSRAARMTATDSGKAMSARGSDGAPELKFRPTDESFRPTDTLGRRELGERQVEHRAVQAARVAGDPRRQWRPVLAQAAERCGQRGHPAYESLCACDAGVVDSAPSAREDLEEHRQPPCSTAGACQDAGAGEVDDAAAGFGGAIDQPVAERDQVRRRIHRGAVEPREVLGRSASRLTLPESLAASALPARRAPSPPRTSSRGSTAGWRCTTGRRPPAAPDRQPSHSASAKADVNTEPQAASTGHVHAVLAEPRPGSLSPTRKKATRLPKLSKAAGSSAASLTSHVRSGRRSPLRCRALSGEGSSATTRSGSKPASRIGRSAVSTAISTTRSR